MKKYIVTTTINPPTLATIKYSRKEDWTLIVVGDTKTPHYDYENLNCIYLSPEYQEKTYPELSETIGWKSIQRRNIGFVEAYNRGADIIATVDDDNIPYDDWGTNVIVGETVEIDFYNTDLGVLIHCQLQNTIKSGIVDFRLTWFLTGTEFLMVENSSVGFWFRQICGMVILILTLWHDCLFVLS